METKTLSMVQHPRDLVWVTMRDRLPEIVAAVEDVESVALVSCQELAGNLCTEYLWQARPKLPALVAVNVRPEMLRWTDRARWSEPEFICTWEIEPHAFRESIQCRGTTRYELAMGGRGTRITFTSDFQLGRARDGAPGNPMLHLAEPILRGLIPKNFSKVVAALAALLAR